MKEIKTWRKFIPGLAFPKGEDYFVIGREIRPTPLVADWCQKWDQHEQRSRRERSGDESAWE